MLLTIWKWLTHKHDWEPPVYDLYYLFWGNWRGYAAQCKTCGKIKCFKT